MLQRTFLSAFAGLFLSAMLVQNAAAIAYPATATTSRTTVTGVYNPLNLDLTLSNGVDALFYDSLTSSSSFQADYTGTFTGVGYDAFGSAGTWRLLLSDSFFGGDSTNTDGDLLFMFAPAVAQVGTLTYLGGLVAFLPTSGGLPPGDTPVEGDVFKIYSTIAGTVFRVDCNGANAADECHEFDLVLGQTLRLDGPFKNGDTDIDTLRKCVPTANITCGGFTLVASGTEGNSVPEPATLALLGIGLAGLGLLRRPRQA